VTKIISISVPTEDEYLIAELDHLAGSRSKLVVEAIRQFVKTHKLDLKRPDWYIEGKDYGYLPLEKRKELVQFGYKDADVG